MDLVTGANGLLGSCLIYDLALKGRTVRALKRKGSSMDLVEFYFRQRQDLLKGIEWVEGDILDIFSLEEALQGVEHIYHCAAKVSFDPSDYEHMMRMNVTGTANMVNMSMQAGVKKFCHVSSVAAIGRSLDGEHITEETLWQTSRLNSSYAISKYGAEREVWRGFYEGLDMIIVNPTVILGKGNWQEGSSSMIRKVYEGLRFYTRGTNGFVDVTDVSKAMILLMQSTITGERFILNSSNVSYRDFFSQAAEFLKRPAPSYEAGPFLSSLAWRFEKIKSLVTGKPLLITRETARTANNRYFYSNSKMETRTGMTFIPVEKSLQNLCEQFLSEQI